MIPALIKIDANKESPEKSGIYFAEFYTSTGHLIQCSAAYNIDLRLWIKDDIAFWYKEVLVHTEQEVKEAYNQGFDNIDTHWESQDGEDINTYAEQTVSAETYYNEKFKKI